VERLHELREGRDAGDGHQVDVARHQRERDDAPVAALERPPDLAQVLGALEITGDAELAVDHAGDDVLDDVGEVQLIPAA
jgi:hypothetical protein